MNFDLRKFLNIVKIVAPIALAAAGVPFGIVADVTAGIAAAESIPGATGAQKKASVVAIAQAALDAIPALSTETKANALEAVDEGVDTTIALTKAVHNVAPVVNPAP